MSEPIELEPSDYPRRQFAVPREDAAVPEFIWLICQVCNRTTFAPLGTFCQFDEVDLVDMVPATTDTTDHE